MRKRTHKSKMNSAQNPKNVSVSAPLSGWLLAGGRRTLRHVQVLLWDLPRGFINLKVFAILCVRTLSANARSALNDLSVVNSATCAELTTAVMRVDVCKLGAV